jgi:hypothetical protein
LSIIIRRLFVSVVSWRIRLSSQPSGYARSSVDLADEAEAWGVA